MATSKILEALENVILELDAESSGPVIEALLVHEDDMDKIRAMFEEAEKTHPTASAFMDCLQFGVQVYKWDGSEWLRKKFGGNIPEPGKPIASYNDTLHRMAQKIRIVRKVNEMRRDGGTR